MDAVQAGRGGALGLRRPARTVSAAGDGSVAARKVCASSETEVTALVRTTGRSVKPHAAQRTRQTVMPASAKRTVPDRRVFFIAPRRLRSVKAPVNRFGAQTFSRRGASRYATACRVTGLNECNSLSMKRLLALIRCRPAKSCRESGQVALRGHRADRRRTLESRSLFMCGNWHGS